MLKRKLMHVIDEQCLNKPYYCLYHMLKWLIMDGGYMINIKHVRWLYRLVVLKSVEAKTKNIEACTDRQGVSVFAHENDNQSENSCLIDGFELCPHG